MRKLSRQEVVRKAITVFEAIRRMASKGGAGLEPERGAEEEYNCVDDCTQQLREILREMQEHDHDRELQRQVEEKWEKEHAEDKIIRGAQDDTGRVFYQIPGDPLELKPDDNKSGEYYPELEREWQKRIRQAGGPPERLVL